MTGQGGRISPCRVAAWSQAAIVSTDQISIAIQPAGLLSLLRGISVADQPVADDLAAETGAPLVLTLPLERRRVERDTRLLVNAPEARKADPALVRMLARLAFLAPDIMCAILEGRHPARPRSIPRVFGVGAMRRLLAGGTPGSPIGDAGPEFEGALRSIADLFGVRIKKRDGSPMAEAKPEPALDRYPPTPVWEPSVRDGAGSWNAQIGIW